MADWTQLDTNLLLPGEPLTSAKALAFFENPIAMAEGAADAPKVVSEALNLLQIRSAGSQNVTALNLDRIATLLVMGFVTSNGTNVGVSRLEYELSSDNGSSFGLATTIVSVANNTTFGSERNSGAVFVDMVGFNAIRFTTNFGLAIAIGVEGVSP